SIQRVVRGTGFIVDSQQMTDEIQRCINECLNCHSICLSTVTYCLQQGGKHAEAQHIQLLLACAEIYRTSADFMLLGTDLHTRTCAVCAEVCEQCAESCEQMGNDAQMQACAQACRRCAESCRQMAGT